MTERIYLSDDKSVYLDALCLDKYDGLPARKAMIVFPGGGYSHLAPHEGDYIAAKYFANDFNVFTLHYTINKNRTDMSDENGVPRPLIDASRAVAYVRKNAAYFGVRPDRICVIGFSAGGHLASCLATGWHDKLLTDAAGIGYGENRPDAAVLCYAVISPETGDVCRRCIGELFTRFADSEKEALVEKYTPCKNVSDKTCPIFMMHTAKDTTVPAENAFLMSEALFNAHLPHELYVLPHAPHGIGATSEDMRFVNERWGTYNSSWVKKSIKWLTYMFGEN